MLKHAYFSERFVVLSRRKKKKVEFSLRPGVSRETIFKLFGILPKITDGKNGETCILFRAVCRTFNNNKKRKKVELSLRPGVSRGTIFKLFGILPKITDGTNGESCIPFSRFSCTFEKKKKKKKKVQFSLRCAVVVKEPFSNF